MHTYCFTWNDAEKNRQVEMSVAYSLCDGAVRIDGITPFKVSFVCAQRGEVTRSIGVYTATARRLLVEAYHKGAIGTHLKHAILAGSIVEDDEAIEPRIAV